MPALTRRGFGALLASPLLMALPSAAFAQPTASPTRLPVFARYRVGRFVITVVSDGYIDFPFEMFTGVTPEQARSAAAAVFAAGEGGVRGSFATYLVEDGDMRILVDSGAAGSVSPTSGYLLPTLAFLGLEPRDIDAVILTHAHIDHIGGMIAGGRTVFPEAEVYIDRREIESFTDPSVEARAPEITKSSFAAARRLVELYPRLQRIDGDREITRGVSVFDLSGHTPGQVGVRIEDDGIAMSLVSDMLFHPVAHPAMPNVGIVFEMDKEAADATRARFFASAADGAMLLAATHMPFPGVGRIRDRSGTLDWLPADWSYVD